MTPRACRWRTAIVLFITTMCGVSTLETAPALRRRFTIEGSIQPSFLDSSHSDEKDSLIRQEQARIWERIRQELVDTSVVPLDVSTRLLNALHIELDANDDAIEQVQYRLSRIPEVSRVHISRNVEFAASSGNTNVGEDQETILSTEDLLHTIGWSPHCAWTGRNVRVAVLDGGIDYTHVALGGNGSFVNSHFPNTVVVSGRDFLGDAFRDGDAAIQAQPDDDPWDGTGHGTAVAHALHTVAPQADLVSIKICAGGVCPDFALVRGLEYALDANDDGVVDDDHVHIVNLSLGRDYASSYYSLLARATEQLAALGSVLPVLSAGNYGNHPFILGDAPATPNALTVGATLRDTHHMANYSSRGPAEGNRIKPDLVAPGGPCRWAAAATGDQYRTMQGTSFAAPLVAGAAALLQEKCQFRCSPLALKALLMNHAVPVWQNETLAPVSLQGSGEMQLYRSLAATYWVYSLQDVNPSISLGLINVVSNIQQVHRTLRIIQLSNGTDVEEPIALRYQLRTSLHSRALSIQFSPASITLNGNCQDEYFVNVTFTINATEAPSNHMSSGGMAGSDPATLDFNEVDGWIRLSSNRFYETSSSQFNGSNVVIPFHALLRKAAHVTIGVSSFDEITLNVNHLPTNLTVNIENYGTEVAQIDAFELLYVSTDQSESEYGSNNPPADIRFIGYRTLPLHEPDCTTLIEFAIQTWESQQSLSYTHFNIRIDTNFDELAEYSIFNSGYRLGSQFSEMRRINTASETEYCVGFAPDHCTNTANTVLRFCSEDIGINSTDTRTIVNVAVSSFSFPEDKVTDMMDFRKIPILQAVLSVPSYDVEPGAVLRNITVSGGPVSADFAFPLGLLLFTNSFRSSNSTGAATRESEAIVILREGVQAYTELSPDILQFPIADDIIGPGCAWHLLNATLSCQMHDRRGRHLDWNAIRTPSYSTNTKNRSVNLIKRVTKAAFRMLSNSRKSLRQRKLLPQATCPEVQTPRLNPILISKSEHPITSSDEGLALFDPGDVTDAPQRNDSSPSYDQSDSMRSPAVTNFVYRYGCILIWLALL
jgi:Subtilase family